MYSASTITSLLYLVLLRTLTQRSKHRTGNDDDATWIPTKAALRFTLQKVNPIVSTFSIVDVNGAENNYANTVTSVGETCESTSGT